MQYRKILYNNYHSTQSGRASGVDARSLFEIEKSQFGEEIIPLIKHKAKDSVIFDIGCGSGSLLKVLQESGFKNSSGIDISPEQVSIAHKMDVLNVSEGDALEYIKSKNNSCDILFGMDIIEHFTKDELVNLLQDCLGYLKPGGMAIFRTPNLDGILSSVYANGDFTHENYLNASSAMQVCLACGFDKVKIISAHMKIKNGFKELVRSLLWPLIKFQWKLYLFATARSSSNVLLTPNMIILAHKPI
ncbi:MAG: class I SAM-dependent methyltransferase [Saprospiraceae bacterium]